MKKGLNIFLIFMVLLANACDYAIDRIQIPEKKDKAADWRIERIDEFPYRHNIDGKAITFTRFFYENDQLAEVHAENRWRKYYYYQDHQLISRVKIDWNNQDTIDIDSFFYFELPALLKEKRHYTYFTDPMYQRQKCVHQYSYNPEAQIIQEEITPIDQQWSSTRLHEIDWEDNNPVEIRMYSIRENKREHQPFFRYQFTYDNGVNFELYKRWDPDAIFAENNQTTVMRHSTPRGGYINYENIVQYDRQGKTIRSLRLATEQSSIPDTVLVTYQ